MSHAANAIRYNKLQSFGKCSALREGIVQPILFNDIISIKKRWRVSPRVEGGENTIFLITTVLSLCGIQPIENKLVIGLGFVKLFEILKELLPENKILP